MRAEIVALVARKELTLAWRERTIRGLGIVLGLLLAASLAVSWQSQRAARDVSTRLQSMAEEQWRAQPDRHPHRVAHFGSFAFRDRSALGAFDIGVDSFAGNAIYLEAHVQNSANFAQAREATALLRFGQLTPAFVLQVLVPLLIIFMGCAAVTRERECGTLPILVVQLVSSREILLGKAVGIATAIGLLLLPTCAVTALLLHFLAGPTPAPHALLRVALLVVAYTLYLATWILLGVWASNRARTTAQALLGLLGVWMVCVVFAPKLLPSLGEWLHPSPSRPEFELRLSEEVVKGGHGHNPGDPQFEAAKRALLKKHGVAKVDDLPVNFKGIAMKLGEEHSAATYQRHYWALQRIYQAQNRLSEWGALLDPFLGIRGFSMAVSGTDYHHFADFERQAEAHRYAFIQKLNEMHIHEVGFRTDGDQRLSRDHWQAFPPFVYRHPSVPWALVHIGPAVAGLLIWFGVALAACWRAEVRA
ncbi:MAG: DUF3526 domain-containing protein [Armatimonadetes bacterium]|nr:DUF3526 domain-containing protein [Armatimonadota bacterium]